jgi:2-polyprenyl-3-methyl-5-hydroxy-6-metoxy-1,4-benzoquinol methylase
VRHAKATPEGTFAARQETVAVNGRGPDYLFGQSAEEAERLRLQARMFAPYTGRFLEDAGISVGMKVLDVGTGAGDVALLVAGLVGQEGTVVGIDYNAELIETARARAAAAGLERVSFVVGDAASVELDRDFDAVVGRCVLFFAREPAALVRRLTDYVRDGGIVAFQEPANATMAPMSLPHSLLLERLWTWILETYRRADMDPFMGLRLCSIFRQAGLPVPAMHFDAAAGGGPDWPGYEYMARLIRTILPQITKLGVATEDDVGIDTLADRLRAEIGANGAAVTWGFITAWAQHQTLRSNGAGAQHELKK